MPKVWMKATLPVVLIFLTGCPSPPKRSERLTPLYEPAAAISAPVSEPSLAPEASGAVYPPPPRLELKDLAVDGWIQSDQLSRAWQLGPVEALPGSSLPSFKVESARGILTFTVGSDQAAWNGLKLLLGFRPRLADGIPAIHFLDAKKTLEPLFLAPEPRLNSDRILLLDPGHGGENTGAKSILDNRYEKHYTLDWALRAKPLLEARGWKVLLTRQEDKTLSLSERVVLADQVQASLFVSLHFNSAHPALARPNHGGIETYCLTPVGMPSNLVREFDDNPERSFPNNGFDAENLYFAVKLHAAMLQLTQANDRGIRRARFMDVLRGQKRPAVLLEGGFLTDREEMKRIASSDYRQKLAEALAVALAD